MMKNGGMFTTGDDKMMKTPVLTGPTHMKTFAQSCVMTYSMPHDKFNAKIRRLYRELKPAAVNLAFAQNLDYYNFLNGANVKTLST